jgi:hypothetical protein
MDMRVYVIRRHHRLGDTGEAISNPTIDHVKKKKILQ